MKVVDPELRRRFRESCFCEICRKPFPGGVHCMHVIARGVGAGSQLDIEENLLGGCYECHQKHHNGLISPQELWEKIALRLHREPAEVELTARRLLASRKR